MIDKYDLVKCVYSYLHLIRIYILEVWLQPKKDHSMNFWPLQKKNPNQNLTFVCSKNNVYFLVYQSYYIARDRCRTVTLYGH